MAWPHHLIIYQIFRMSLAAADPTWRLGKGERKAPAPGRAGRGGGDHFLIASRMPLAWAVRSVSGSSLMNFSRFSAALAVSPLFR